MAYKQNAVSTDGTQVITNKDLTSGTNTFPTFNQNTTGSAAKLTTARTIGGTSFDGTANITVASATGGFTISGGDLALGANNITITGSLGATGARLTKGWFTDLQVTNAIAGSITGNAATVTNATLTTALTVNTGTLTLTANAANTSVLTIGAGAVSISGTHSGTSSGTNTGDQTTISGNAGTATALQNARTLWGQSFDGTGNISGSQTGIGDMTGGASSMIITAGTGASRTLTFKTTTAGSTATTALTLAADQSATFANTVNATTFVGALTGTASGNLVSGGALGTPSSGTLTNATGLPIAGLVASTSTAIGVGSIELGHASDTTITRVSSGKIAVEGVNVVTTSSTDTLTNKSMSEAQLTFTDITTGNASTSNHGFLLKLNNSATQFMNGQGAWATPASSPKLLITADFSNSARLPAAVVNGGTVTFGTSGITLASSSTSTNDASQAITISGSNSSVFSGSPTFTACFSLSAIGSSAGTAANTFLGMGAMNPNSYTTAHIGFKALASTTSTVATLYATQGDGSTENASAALTTFGTSDNIQVMCVVNGTSSVDYYWSKNNGAWSAATNLTTNLPTSASATWLQLIARAGSSTGAINMIVNYVSYQR